jgi:hypothetical protein
MNKALLGAAVMTDLIRATSGPSLRELYRSLERYVDRVLRGTKPSDLPFDLPTEFELVINLKTGQGDRPHNSTANPRHCRRPGG